MDLEQELETYQRELPSLLGQEGKYAVVSADVVVGVFETYEDALKVAYEKCGVRPFLLKKIQAVEQVQWFSRDLDLSCRT